MELKFVIQVPRLGVILHENIILEISYSCYNLNMVENNHHERSKDREGRGIWSVSWAPKISEPCMWEFCSNNYPTVSL